MNPVYHIIHLHHTIRCCFLQTHRTDTEKDGLQTIMEEPVIRLRPHHALCSMHFAGKGYNEEFARNMSAIHQRLNSGKRQMVNIIMHRDSLCEFCPHDYDYACKREEKIQELDRAVAEACHIRSGQWLPWSELSALISEKLMPDGTLPGLCDNCEWHAVCEKQHK